MTRRIVTLLALVVAPAVTACGGIEEPELQAPTTTAAVRGPSDAPPGRPSAPSIGPPPAWVDTAAGRVWMTTGSSCRRTEHGSGCADAAAAPCTSPRLARLRAPLGGVVRFHLEVEPRAISLSRLRWDGRPPDDVPSVRLPPVHEPTWRAVGPPTQAMLFVEDRDGDVAYLVCLDIR